jgi:hypothetical protein
MWVWCVCNVFFLCYVRLSFPIRSAIMLSCCVVWVMNYTLFVDYLIRLCVRRRDKKLGMLRMM